MLCSLPLTGVKYFFADWNMAGGGMTSVFVTPRDVKHDPHGFMTTRTRPGHLQKGKHSKRSPRIPSPEYIAFVKGMAAQLSRPQAKLRVVVPMAVTCRLQTRR